MQARTRNKLLALGFATDFVAKIDRFSHTIEALRSLATPALLTCYTSEEVGLIQDRIKRQPISDVILQRVIDKSGESCCFCADGNSTRPYQIHHAEEYARTQDNSEENLILICPTHHQSIPKRLSAAEQKSERNRWHVVIEIAKAYQSRGLDFPFGLFNARDFGLDPRPEELIDGYRLSNATALASSDHDLARQGIDLIRARGLLPIVGASGDGKTTLALGIAGHLWRDGFRVLSYQPPRTGRPFPLQDVLTFLHAADRRCVLLLDDANHHFSEADLTEIAAAITPSSLVIATWTRVYLDEASRFERHLPHYLVVNWENIRAAVKAFLLANEFKVVSAIRRHRKSREVRSVGMGYLDTPLEHHILRYEAEAKSVSQFFFLLRGGSAVVQQEIESLANHARSDVPVLYAAIEQIAGYETPVTAEEASIAIRCVDAMNSLPAPTTYPFGNRRS